MNQQQFKFLKERLSRLNQRKYNAVSDLKTRKPADVVRAEKIVKAWQAKCQKLRGQRQERINEAYAKAHQAIIFREAPDALAALKEFERFRP